MTRTGRGKPGRAGHAIVANDVAKDLLGCSEGSEGSMGAGRFDGGPEGAHQSRPGSISAKGGSKARLRTLSVEEISC